MVRTTWLSYLQKLETSGFYCAGYEPGNSYRQKVVLVLGKALPVFYNNRRYVTFPKSFLSSSACSFDIRNHFNKQGRHKGSPCSQLVKCEVLSQAFYIPVATCEV